MIVKFWTVIHIPSLGMVMGELTAFLLVENVPIEKVKIPFVIQPR